MRWMFISILSLVLILAACGGDDTGNTGGDAFGEEENASANQEDESTSDDANTEDTQSDGSNSDDGRDLFQGVISYELEIEMSNNDEWSYDYEVEKYGKEGEIDRDGESDLDGREAIDQIEDMIEAVQPSPDLSYDEALQRIYDHLEINQEDIQAVELDVDFKNGDTLEIKRPS